MDIRKAVLITLVLALGGAATAHTVLAQRASTSPTADAMPSGHHAPGAHHPGPHAAGATEAGGHGPADRGATGHGAGSHDPAGPATAHGSGRQRADTRDTDGHRHHPHHARHGCHHHAGRQYGATVPAAAGQDAFAAVAEIVRILDADPTTDWSTVDLERLRQHLVDMHEVVLRSTVKQAVVPDGLAMEITGRGRTERAIRAMVPAHATELDGMPQWSAHAESIPGGVRLTVKVANAEDTKTLARIRGLGFIGLLTEGAHHGPHHLAMARGQMMPGHRH